MFITSNLPRDWTRDKIREIFEQAQRCGEHQMELVLGGKK